jgi:glycine dehydrogenase subunit 1
MARLSFIPNTDRDREEMLKVVGVPDFNALIEEIPQALRLDSLLDLPPPLSEAEVLRLLKEMASRNRTGDLISFLGGGAYDHFIPSVIDHVISRSEFYTAYTPYQPEVSQGTLQAIYEFQSLIAELTEMEVANASLYDGGSALAEAVHFSRAATRRPEIILSHSINPHYARIVETYCRGLDVPIGIVPAAGGITDLDALRETVGAGTACVAVQHPNFFGCLEPVAEISDIVHGAGGLLVVSIDPVSLGVLVPPGRYGCDVAVGEGQALGIPQNLGGPYLGLFACRRDLVRLLPGRLVGATTDSEGKRGYVLTLQTREQHIRRERATSNICTNEALCALAAAVYLSLMGRHGMRRIGELCLQKSHYLVGRLIEIEGVERRFDVPFFKECVLQLPINAQLLIDRLLERGYLAGVDLGEFHDELADSLLVAVTEQRTREEIDRFAGDFAEAVLEG